ncbi:hypothetical protein GCM10027321_41640 [Massilia terrae]
MGRPACECLVDQYLAQPHGVAAHLHSGAQAQDFCWQPQVHAAPGQVAHWHLDSVVVFMAFLLK